MQPMTDEELATLSAGVPVLVVMPAGIVSETLKHMQPEKPYKATVSGVTLVDGHRPLVSMWMQTDEGSIFILNRDCAHLNYPNTTGPLEWEVYRGDLS